MKKILYNFQWNSPGKRRKRDDRTLKTSCEISFWMLRHVSVAISHILLLTRARMIRCLRYNLTPEYSRLPTFGQLLCDGIRIWYLEQHGTKNGGSKLTFWPPCTCNSAPPQLGLTANDYGSSDLHLLTNLMLHWHSTIRKCILFTKIWFVFIHQPGVCVCEKFLTLFHGKRSFFRAIVLCL